MRRESLLTEGEVQTFTKMPVGDIMEQVANPVWPDSYRKVEATDFCQRLGTFSNALTQHPHVAFDKAFLYGISDRKER